MINAPQRAAQGHPIHDLAKVQIEEAGPEVFGLAAWLDFSSPDWKKEIQTKEEDS